MSASYAAIQQDIQSELFREVGRNRFRLWFRDTEVSRVDDGSVTLAVPTEVHRTWLECTYGEMLHRAASQVLGDGVRVRLEVCRRQGLRREIRDRLPSSVRAWEDLLARRRPRPTLDGFVCTAEGRFPVMLLQHLVHGNGAIDPPAVYLYGEEGTGKTHLLEALHGEAKAFGPGESVYLTSRRFTQMYVSVLRARDLDAIRAFEVDFAHRRLVILDDLHRLSGRKATQRALVRLREKTIGSPTRFVFASRHHPRELERISPRLRSWLMGGVLLRLPTPGRDVRAQTLRERARAYGVAEVPDAVLSWILDHTGSLGGAIPVMDRWAAASAEIGSPLEAEWLEEIEPSVSVTTREEIVRRAKRAVAAHYALPHRLLDTPTKTRRAAMPRRIGMYLVYRATALPLAEIGLAFGLKSHSSVSRAIQEVREAREADPALEQVVDGLLARM